MVKLAKTGHGLHSSTLVCICVVRMLLFVLFGCYFYCSMYCLCVNVYCHRVTTQLQLINLSVSITQGPHKLYYSFISAVIFRSRCSSAMPTSVQAMISRKKESFRCTIRPSRFLSVHKLVLHHSEQHNIVPHAHHQELINCSSRLPFTVGGYCSL
jgi:hypothetical protein